jgi:O-antigen/teichoic acid export membrane protein
LYGAEYVPYSYLVWIYSAHYVLVYLGYPMRFALRTLHFTSPIFVAYGIGAGLSLFLAFPMVQAWGMKGVMAGLMGLQVMTLLVYAFFLHRETLLPGYQRGKTWKT